MTYPTFSRPFVRHRRVLLAGAVSALALTSSSCADSQDASDSANRSTRIDSAGVELVAIPATERAFPDSLQEVLRIEPADSGLGAFGSFAPGAVASNGVDRLYVLAADDAQIVAFDDLGTPLARFGRRGGGPGEFEYGDGLVVSADGSVGVYDFAKNALLRFDANGAILSPVSPPRDSAGSPGAPVIPSGESLLFHRRLQKNDSVFRSLVVAAGPDTSVLASLTNHVTANVAFESCPVRMMGMEPYFSPTMTVAIAPSGGWVVQRGAEWRVETYNGTRLTRVLTRALPARPTTVDLLERELSGGLEIRFGNGSCKIPTSEAATAIGMAPSVPALRRVAVAPDGTVWAERFEAWQDEQRVDVISAQGELLGTIAGRGAPLAFLRDGRVVYGETDEDTGLMTLVILRVPNAGW